MLGGLVPAAILAGLVLTRFAGYLVAASLVLTAIVELLTGRERSVRGTLRLLLPALIPAIVASLAWRLVRAGFETQSVSMIILLTVAVSDLANLVLSSARKFFAEVGYVSLSTFGFALPAALWALLSGMCLLLVRLRPREHSPLVCDVEVEVPAPAQAQSPPAITSGPAQVATETYRKNWDAIYGRGRKSRSMLN